MRLTRHTFAFGVLAAALLLAACGGTEQPSADGGVCETGTEGCPCAEGERCGLSEGGEQLVCRGNVCEALSCPAGESGCACRAGSACNAPSDSCQGGFCIRSGCTPGEEACTCLAGSCDVGLTCLEGSVCVDSTGYEGGACLDNGRCHRGNRCDPASSRCVFCEPGSAGCQCTEAGGCSAGLACAAGLCVPASQLPPANPACYTPCRGDLEVDGGVLRCTTDNVLPGCLPGQTCTDGSCLAPGESKPTCEGDLDCPFFQVCLSGGCYSNCEVNADCPSGLGCFQHACRTSCTVAKGQATCPAGFACTADDGENGYCTPVGAPTANPQAPSAEGLRMPLSRLALSNVAQSGSLIVVPTATVTQDVTVRRLWHSVTYNEGGTERTVRVDAPLDAKGNFRECDPARNECPLWWLQLSAPGTSASQAPTVGFRLVPGCVDDVTQPGAEGTPCPRLGVGNAGGVEAVRWEGALSVTASGGGSTTITLSYVERPEGQWVGSMYYFGTFDRTGVQAWSGRADKTDVSGVENGLLQRWGALRRGFLEGWPEFLAVLTATRTESWKFGVVAERCRDITGDPATACYPFTNTAGVRPYVQDTLASPIPSGVTELPVAMNLKLSPTQAAVFQGRIESAVAMHYPGNPALTLEFAADPAVAEACAQSGGSDCLVYLKTTGASLPEANRLVSTVGGRYVPAPGTPCAEGFVLTHVPWLVPGFTQGTTQAQGGERTRAECRDSRVPFDTQADSRLAAVNQSLAGGNPVPDGAPRRRTLRFLDGALVNQSELFILFEESYESFIPGQDPTTAYGYMLLKRAAADLEPEHFVGLPAGPDTGSALPGGLSGAQCSADLLAGLPASVTANKALLVKVLLEGTSASGSYSQVPLDGHGRPLGIHYFCEDTGLFNGGPEDDGTAGATRIACPAGSNVIFFNVGTNRTPEEMARLPCQTQEGPDGRARCFDTLEQWRINRNVIIEEDPVYTCTQAGQVLCSDDRLDLRKGKTFYKRSSATPVRNMIALRPLIDAAFRYKTRFRSSTDGTLGFAPRQCVPDSDSVPYCYDPAQVEEARARIDCLVHLYADGTTVPLLDADTRGDLLDFLRASFSRFPQSYEGFERLYAELLIMQGDEALTAAYASRFDLAATGGASFRGSAFEPGGIDLTGVAGAELYRLYEAVQYYQLALDRLYMFGPDMHTAHERGPVGSSVNFISPEMVTSYLERLVRAASQKSRAWAEVARRYQNFNRPDLARSVIERAYVSTYLESALISWLMLDIAENSSLESQAQNRVTIEKAQRSYRMALLDMREVYEQISEEMNFFGFPPDYIPFPALDTTPSAAANAYDALAVIARQRLDLARVREQVALSSAKQGRVDMAQFQSDLTSIRNTYENQLAQVCGTFSGSDGRVYPAIRKYAHQDPVATLMGDPCGRMGNGELHNAMGAVKDTGLKLQGVLLRHENALKEISIEQTRVAEQCDLTETVANFQYETAGTVADLQHEMANSRALANFIAGSVNAVMSSIQVLDCEIQCASSVAMAASVATMGVAVASTQYSAEKRVANVERSIRDFERESVKLVTQSQCTAQQIDSRARVANLINSLLEVELEMLRAEYAMRLASAEVRRHFSNAQRVQAQQEEAEQLAIDIQAAQNDPNVRIYQNDAVINADVSFRDALAMAYRLTRLFEYYTSQTYAKKEQLFLIRMVQAGQYNLENYLLELDNELQAFEEQFGNPELRVLALSLRDDIMQIPYLSESGAPLGEGERIALMRERLRDVRLLDGRGYLTLPFSTSLDALSPLTRNHKVRHVEVDLQGARMGDPVARVYLRMAGTGVVRNVSDAVDFYVFPERLGVINATLLGSKLYDPEVYRNYRFRDRPLVNTQWELVLNQRDEVANKDIDLQSLTDIRLLFYYSDFTTF